MADERLRCGAHVRVIGPAATSPGDTFAIGKETTVAELRTDDDGHTVYACQISGWGFVPFPRASLERIARPAQPQAPRAIIRHFAAAMERKMAANDGVKGGWRDGTGWNPQLGLRTRLQEEMGELLEALDAFTWRDGTEEAVLLEAADVALFAMMLADIVGALPPTDERGR